MKRIGVIGAGVMGLGVTQSMAAHGHEVVLVDVDEAALDRVRQRLASDARLARLLGVEAAEVDPSLVHLATDLSAVDDVDFVVENITEKWHLKAALYPRLDDVCRPDVVIAANTSAISITRLAGLTQRADRILGMHFMNPVPVKPTVEVIRGWHTSDDTVDTALGLLGAIGKRGVVVADAPGFVSNRVLMLTVNEAVYLVQDQVATAAEVDEIFRSCFGHPMGPLETADLIGLDTILYSIDVLHESFSDSKYRPCPLLRRMVDAGLHGRKSGQGFYSYN